MTATRQKAPAPRRPPRPRSARQTSACAGPGARRAVPGWREKHGPQTNKHSCSMAGYLKWLTPRPAAAKGGPPRRQLAGAIGQAFFRQKQIPPGHKTAATVRTASLTGPAPFPPPLAETGDRRSGVPTRPPNWWAPPNGRRGGADRNRGGNSPRTVQPSRYWSGTVPGNPEKPCAWRHWHSTSPLGSPHRFPA